MKNNKEITLEDIIKGFDCQDVYWLSKAITLVESTLPEHQDLARLVLKTFLPKTGTSRRIGITGPPGVGKSSLINSFCKTIGQQGKRVAVLSIDPSSTSTGGSLLGDKLRMIEAQQLDSVFIRPSPAGAVLGGLTRSTYESLLLCEAFGFDYTLIESVGVGQSEMNLEYLADLVLMVVQPAVGDEVQGMKRGVLEGANGVFVNKEDLNPNGASETAINFKNSVGLISDNRPWVLKGSIGDLESLERLWNKLDKTWLDLSIELTEKRSLKKSQWMDFELKEELMRTLATNQQFQKTWRKYKEMVLNRELSSFEAIKSILDELNLQDE